MSFTSLDRKLLARLQKHGVVPEDQVEDLARRAGESPLPFARFVVAEGITDEKTVAKQAAKLYGMDFIDIEKHPPGHDVAAFLAADLARRRRVVPIADTPEFLVVGVADGTDLVLVDELRLLSGRVVRTVLVTEKGLADCLARFYPAENAVPPSPASVEAPPPPPITKRTSSSSSSDMAQLATQMVDRETLAAERLAAGAARIVRLPEPERSIEDELEEARRMAARADEYIRRTGSTAEDLLMRSGFVRQPSFDSAAPPEDDLSDNVIDGILHDMIDTALINRAEEMEFSPHSAERPRMRLRRDGYWMEATPYPERCHDAILRRLRRIANIEAGQALPIECHFELLGRRGRIPTIAAFTATPRGDRCVLRFPENVPLLQKPLRLLAIGDEPSRALQARLSGAGGGLLLLTSRKIRYAQQFYASLLFSHVDAAARTARGEDTAGVVSIDWALDRRLPGVKHIDASSDETFRHTLDSLARQPAALVGVQAVPSAPLLRDVFELAARGQTVVACFAAASHKQTLGAFGAAGIDGTALSRSVAAHVHIERVPRLCATCREPLAPRPAELPLWADAIPDAALREANGCPACAGTGRRGVNWLCETWVPDPDGDEPLRLLRTREELYHDFVASGDADPRDLG